MGREERGWEGESGEGRYEENEAVVWSGDGDKGRGIERGSG